MLSLEESNVLNVITSLKMGNKNIYWKGFEELNKDSEIVENLEHFRFRVHGHDDEACLIPQTDRIFKKMEKVGTVRSYYSTCKPNFTQEATPKSGRYRSRRLENTSQRAYPIKAFLSISSFWVEKLGVP